MIVRTDQTPRSGKPAGRILRRFLLGLALTLAVFGVLGAVVTLVPRDAEPPETVPREIPQARQVDRKSLQ